MWTCECDEDGGTATTLSDGQHLPAGTTAVFDVCRSEVVGPEVLKAEE